MSGGRAMTTMARAVLAGVACVLVAVLAAWLLAGSRGGAQGVNGGSRGPGASPVRTGAETVRPSAPGSPGDLRAAVPGSSAHRPSAGPNRDPGRANRAAAVPAVASYLAKVPTILSRRPRQNRATVASLGTPAFADELQATAALNRADGLRVVGSPTVTRIRVLRSDLQGRPPRVVVEACIDSSEVRLVDRRGRAVPEARHGPTRERFSLVWSRDRWLIDGQEFSDDPNC